MTARPGPLEGQSGEDMPSTYATDISEIKKQCAELVTAVAKLTTLVETEGTRCPYREKIQQASNNHIRLSKAEGRIDTNAENIVNNRVGIAKLVALGGSGGLVVVLVEMLIKSMT